MPIVSEDLQIKMVTAVNTSDDALDFQAHTPDGRLVRVKVDPRATVEVPSQWFEAFQPQPGGVARLTVAQMLAPQLKVLPKPEQPQAKPGKAAPKLPAVE